VSAVLDHGEGITWSKRKGRAVVEIQVAGGDRNM
jgi:hypothetical protein